MQNPTNLLELFDREIRLLGYSYATKKNYLSCVANFLSYFDAAKTVKHISANDIKDYLLEFKTLNTRKHNHSAVKLFYKRVIHQPFKFRYIPYGKKEHRLPIIIDASDIQKLLNVCGNAKHRAIILTLYQTGIRLSELLNIKLRGDVDSTRMVIRIIGKGNKERNVPLSETLLIVLRDYIRAYKPKYFLFEGQGGGRYSGRSIQEFLKHYKAKAGITSPVTPHKFRHSSLTTMLEDGVDLRVIQAAAGHESSKTTESYTHVSKNIISKIPSPLNRLQL